MKTVGEILKKTRAERGFSLEEVAAATKIHRSHLQALEENNFHCLPSATSARGFLKNYAEFLKLDPQPILAIFRRDFVQKEKGKIVPLGMFESFSKTKISWTPKLTLILISSLFFLALSVYLGHQYFSLIKPPSLTIIAPDEGQQILEEKVEVLGKADPDSLVTINGELVFLSPKGEFRYQLDLFPGENKIIIEAESKRGEKTKIERTIFRLDKTP